MAAINNWLRVIVIKNTAIDKEMLLFYSIQHFKVITVVMIDNILSRYYGQLTNFYEFYIALKYSNNIYPY